MAVEGRSRDALRRGRPGSERKPAQGAGKTAARCPICGKRQVEAFRPFCSKACADIDLSRWLGGRYAIPGPPADRAETETDNETDGDR